MFSVLRWSKYRSQFSLIDRKVRGAVSGKKTFRLHIKSGRNEFRHRFTNYRQLEERYEYWVYTPKYNGGKSYHRVLHYLPGQKV